MDKFVNATKILDSIDAALKQFRLVRMVNQRDFLRILLRSAYSKNMIKNEIQHREFSPCSSRSLD